ncbi:MAG: ABC transporter ATP-binding protein [Gammaproteobacteria bacterium]|nr:ABC transporter ATP-binding protein [Gammaproteobacteria bacterium]NNF59914.1 ABC transporter ATP-binding protein [Gammaproteobacteria bacterium]NNM21648.1 ABC transporter ATP-binding protein [Gammaproteobacteria bacterium]
MSSEPLLSVRNLCIEFSTERGVVRAVDDVSFDVAPGETLGIVGESGCGKTVTALAVLRLIPSPPGKIVSGSIRMGGRDILALSEKQMRDIRGSEISMIFQEPMTALNPVFTIGNQMIDVIRRHRQTDRAGARRQAMEMLERVGIPIPDRRLDEYPHQLSGGMRQRVMIAMALSCGPKLLIADEPTTALDVTTQAQVMEQIVKLQQEFGMAVMLITHDLGVIAESCSRAAVMYCGQVIEDAPIGQLFEAPQHPYTQGLLRSIPRIRQQRLDELPVIHGTVPDLLHLPPGCRFADRCPRRVEECEAAPPPLETRDGARVACYFPGADHG